MHHAASETHIIHFFCSQQLPLLSALGHSVHCKEWQTQDFMFRTLCSGLCHYFPSHPEKSLTYLTLLHPNGEIPSSSRRHIRQVTCKRIRRQRVGQKTKLFFLLWSNRAMNLGWLSTPLSSPCCQLLDALEILIYTKPSSYIFPTGWWAIPRWIKSDQTLGWYPNAHHVAPLLKHLENQLHCRVVQLYKCVGIERYS